MSAPVDVLAWISERVGAHESLSESDAYHAQELPRAQAVNAAVVELIAASRAYFAGYCVDEAEDYFDPDEACGENTGCTRQQHKDAKRLRAALAHIGAA